MIAYQSLCTYRDLLEALQNASEEQLDMRIQCTDSHPVDEYVHKLKQVICVGTVDELDLRYARSVNDNRRNGNEIVLFCDGNPFGEDGRTASTLKDTETASDSKNAKNFLTASSLSIRKITMKVVTGQAPPKNLPIRFLESEPKERSKTSSKIV